MSDNDGSGRWWQLPTYLIEPLTYVLGGGVLLSVLVALALGQSGVLTDSDATFYVTEIAVPLLTFTGFLAVYLGFRSQEEQNELQERQLENQREQLEAQQKNFKKDRFENTFFQLLRTQNQIVNEIRPREKRLLDLELPDSEDGFSELSGRICFEELYSEFGDFFDWKESENTLNESDRFGDFEVEQVYEHWFRKRKSELNHYFNHLTKIISFVDESDIEDKQFYIDLVIAQMSVPELKLFFYHSGSMTDQKRYVGKVNHLLGKYNFFGQLTPSSLLHEEHADLHPDALGVRH